MEKLMFWAKAKTNIISDGSHSITQNLLNGKIGVILQKTAHDDAPGNPVGILLNLYQISRVYPHQSLAGPLLAQVFLDHLPAQ